MPRTTTPTYKIPATEFRAKLLELAAECNLSDEEARRVADVAKPGYRFIPGAFRATNGDERLYCPIEAAFRYGQEDPSQNSLPDHLYELALAIDIAIPMDYRSVELI